ncbi:unnamed protein product [Rhizophagus irregularis]|nr:unnamed protein product [Rhizophagus irregularis]CAB5381152.1 unnamed protein product [Rhizophagus irregularis]
MSFNIAGSSTSSSDLCSSDILTVKKVKELNTPEKLSVFEKNIVTYINTLKVQKVNGKDFLETTQEDLTKLEIYLEPAKNILKLINEIKDSTHSIKHILSGPMGMDASDLDVGGEVICKYFFALNKDILTANNLKQIMQHVDNTFAIVKVNVANAIFTFLKSIRLQNLTVVNKYNALFEQNPSVPERLPVLSPLENLNYWKEHHKFAYKL